MKDVICTTRWVLAAALVAGGLAAPAEAVTRKTIASGLGGAIGTALDETHQRLYFVEYTTGWLKRLELTPACMSSATPTLCAIHNVAGGFSHPEDVALDVDAGLAYVTTRDVPGGGGLYRVDLATGVKTLVAFNLGAPQQLVLRPGIGKAFTVGYDDGRLRRIDLATGAKKVLATGLDHPVGLVVTSDNARAYVSEQGTTNAVSMIALSSGLKSPPIAAGLTAPFFLAWADPAGSALYLAERDPANRVSRLNLTGGGPLPLFPGLPVRPSAIAVGGGGTTLFITTNTEIVLGGLGIDPTLHPDLMGIGLISISEIDASGRANTYDGVYKNAPFGGTLSILANLTHFKTLGGNFYRLAVAKNGGAPEAITRNWPTQKWNPTPPNPAYKPFTVTPVAGTEMYEIPSEYATGNAAWWYPPYVIMKYPTGENGLYDFTLTIHATTTGAALHAYTMHILVDNTPPVVNVHNIYQCNAGTCTQEVLPCDIVPQSDPARFTASRDFAARITANDAEGHLLLYRLYGMYGNNCEVELASDTYNSHVGATPAPGPYAPVLWGGPVMALTAPRTLSCNCAYTFYLYAWGRTTNGYGYIHAQWVDFHKSFTLNQPALPRCSAGGCP